MSERQRRVERQQLLGKPAGVVAASVEAMGSSAARAAQAGELRQLLGMAERGGAEQLPGELRGELQAKGGVDLSDVGVHRDSPVPGMMGALALARGPHIHLAPGQDRHLAHEAWHVVQQKQGRVTATGSVGDVAVSRDPALEREAEAPGAAVERAEGRGAGAVETVQLKTDPTTGEPVTETEEQATARFGELWQLMQQQTPFPTSKTYSAPPKSYIEVIGWLQYGNPTPEQRDWLYKMSTLYGLGKLSMLVEKQRQSGGSGTLDPVRRTIVTFALSQVGLVEAHVFSGQTEKSAKAKGGEIKLNVGAEHLMAYHEVGGPKGDAEVIKDYRYTRTPATTLDGIMRGAWCQTFSRWAWGMAGCSTSGAKVLGPNQVPQPGDIACMKQNEHWAIVIAADQYNVTTVDGNMPDRGSIVVTTRARTAWDRGFQSCT